MKKQSNEKSIEHTVILSVFPSDRGFGFAVFEGPWVPINWGGRYGRDTKNRECLEKLQEIIEHEKPDTLLVKGYAKEGAHRTPRIERFIADIEQLAKKNSIPVTRYSREQIRECFAEFEAQTKHEIAQAISEMLPEFPPQLPPPRKIWEAEHPSMSIFDAVSLIFAHFFHTTVKPQTRQEPDTEQQVAREDNHVRG